MALSHSTGQKNATLTGNTGSVGASGDSTSGHGYNAGSLKVYSGSAPANADAAETGTVLATVTLPNPCFGAAASGVLTANAISAVTISNTGTAGYARLLANGDDGLSSTTERRIQLSVTATGGGGDLQLSSTSLVSGGQLTITSCTYTHPA